MPDADLNRLLAKVPADGSSIGNHSLREALGWTEQPSIQTWFAESTFSSSYKGVAAAIEKMAAPLFAQMKNIPNQSRTLAALRDSLLSKLLSGEHTTPTI